MPRDKNGSLVEVGDSVIIRGKVTEINPCGEFANVRVETEELARPGDNASFIYLNSIQVEKS
jgi:hypothetical protein